MVRPFFEQSGRHILILLSSREVVPLYTCQQKMQERFLIIFSRNQNIYCHPHGNKQLIASWQGNRRPKKSGRLNRSERRVAARRRPAVCLSRIHAAGQASRRSLTLNDPGLSGCLANPTKPWRPVFIRRPRSQESKEYLVSWFPDKRFRVAARGAFTALSTNRIGME